MTTDADTTMIDDPTDTTEPSTTTLSPSADDEIAHRACHLDRTTELTEYEAVVLAYWERGHGESVIADAIGITECEVILYLTRIGIRYGLETIELPTSIDGVHAEFKPDGYAEPIGDESREEWYEVIVWLHEHVTISSDPSGRSEEDQHEGSDPTPDRDAKEGGRR